MADSFFTFLYPLVVFISLSAYIPQVKSLIKAETSSDDISIKAWLLWILSSSIGLGYGIFSLKDILFCITTAVGLIMMTAIVGITLYNRYIKFGDCKNLLQAVNAYIFGVPPGVMKTVAVRKGSRRF